VIEALQIDQADYVRGNTLQPITGFRTGLIGGRMVETSFRQPVSFGIRRIEFDNYLLRRSGVSCAYEAVKELVRDRSRWLVNGKFTAPLIVGAGGHFCPVARFARGSGIANKQDEHANHRNVVYAQEVEFEIPQGQVAKEHVQAEIPELYFCKDLQGYGWCFRKGKYLNVGLGRLEKQGLSQQVHEFWEFLRSRNKVVGSPPAHFLGHAYRLYASENPKPYDDRLLLIGDAAGLAYPNSGEGIRPAIESALIAADVITQAAGDFSSNSLAAYQDRLVKRLGLPQSQQTMNWLPAAWLQKIAAGLMTTRWFARNVVVDNWFLHRRQGALQIIN
jgi:flavin-dependent dehydrogenase